MKNILGLDLGTNSIGWALVNKDKGKILGMGSRIIPMGTDKQKFEKGDGITKNANRREKRTARKGNKRYKIRRNKLLYILHILSMLPDQFQFKELNEKDKNGKPLRLVGSNENNFFKENNKGIPVPQKLEALEIMPIEKKTLQPDSLTFCQMKVDALTKPVDIKDLGKILYNFNQLRGYAGGNNDDENKKKKADEENDNDTKKKDEVIVQKVAILKVEKSEDTFTVRGGINRGEKQNKYDVTILLDNEEKEGQTELQNLEEKLGQEEELEIRIKRTKTGETITFALPQKSNWRKNMEAAEKILKDENLFISELRLRDLQSNKWTRIRNRVFLRNRYEKEFDKIWETQANAHEILKKCPNEILEKIANYIFPGTNETQQQLRQKAIDGGLKYIIKEQVIYYQRPLKPQTELISNCRFEKEEKVISTTHPLFQEFRCWKQINNLYIRTKVELIPVGFQEDLFGNKIPIYDKTSKKSNTKYQYKNRYLTEEEKQTLYGKLQTQKDVGFGAVIDILNLNTPKAEKLDKEQKNYFLNGLNVKAKLKGCDTLISIKKILGNSFEDFLKKDEKIVAKIWGVIFDIKNHDGSEYEPTSKRVSSIIELLQTYTDKENATDLALKLSQNIKFPRKYANLSAKALQNILPLMKPNPQNVSETLKTKFENIKHLVDTGEIIDNADYNLEDSVIEFVRDNPDALQKGGIMESFAISLVYGKHTAETIKPQISNYHEIKYEERNLRNPIVEQLANETMQVIKAIWKQYKFNPQELEIRVELARDLKNSAQEREKIYNGQLKSKKTNNRVKERLREEGIAITDENIIKYRLYEQQKYISPYSGETLTVGAFDTYQIDHILPKQRYYDDSFSNKVLVEGTLNQEKSNRTAWEYITQQNSKYKILSIDDFIKKVNANFFGKKKKNLLEEKIPSNPVERQLKDTQYISVAVKNELAKVVGSENVKTSTGEVTDFLRSRWGLKKLLMELTESRFKQMELWDLDDNGNPKEEWITKEYDKLQQKNIYKIKNWSKRYDHRHHAIDALVVAFTEQSHIQRLNNLNKYVQEELTRRKDEFKIEQNNDETILDAFFKLEANRRDEILQKLESSRKFDVPFDGFVAQVREHLETMVISHKSKDKLGFKLDKFDANTKNKQLKKQLKIRSALHEETYYGKLKNRDTKTIYISELSAKDISKIIDDVLRKEIDEHRKKYNSMKEAFSGEGLKIFNESRFQRKNPTELKPPVYKVKTWYNREEKKESSLQRLYDHNEKQSVITGDNYLFLIMEKNGKRIFDVASLYDSVAIANAALKDNNTEFKLKIAEDFRIKHKDKPEKILFTLQHNELVYLPTSSDDIVLSLSKIEFEEWIRDKENKKEFCKRIFKVVKLIGKNCFFVPHNYANVISVAKNLSKEDLEVLKTQNKGKKKIPDTDLNFVEFGSYGNCSPYNTLFGNNKLKIQDTCIKIKIDWLGNITLI
jgi:CRISPR/Cas system Type II protein with McrA/HNH and RuvC-like nuclease domain